MKEQGKIHQASLFFLAAGEVEMAIEVYLEGKHFK